MKVDFKIVGQIGIGSSSVDAIYIYGNVVIRELYHPVSIDEGVVETLLFQEGQSGLRRDVPYPNLMSEITRGVLGFLGRGGDDTSLSFLCCDLLINYPAGFQWGEHYRWKMTLFLACMKGSSPLSGLGTIAIFAPTQQALLFSNAPVNLNRDGLIPILGSLWIFASRFRRASDPLVQ